MEALILSKLEELASGTGFSPSAIEAAINTIEFSLRENNTGSFPRGLSLMLRAVNAWIYDRDPFQPIQAGGSGLRALSANGGRPLDLIFRSDLAQPLQDALPSNNLT